MGKNLLVWARVSDGYRPDRGRKAWQRRKGQIREYKRKVRTTLFTKHELIRVSKISEEMLDYSINTRLIPGPGEIVWLHAPPQEDCFPDYALGDLIHLAYLRKYGFTTLWELKRSLLGGEGTIRYEADLKRTCGHLLCAEVKDSQEAVTRRLFQIAENSFYPKKIVSVTFRSEKVNSRAFIVLSPVLVRPEQGFRPPRRARAERRG